LVERSGELGGAIPVASRAPGWEAYRSSFDWLARQLAKLPVDVRCDEEATSESIRSGGWDVVVLATGARARRPYLPGAYLPHTATVADVLAGKVPVGHRVVILDETGYTPGPKLADVLSEAGHDVEIVTRQYSLGEDIGTTVRAVLTERLLRKRVRITALNAPVAVTQAGVRLRHVLTDEEHDVAADSVVFSSSGVGDDRLHAELTARWPEGSADSPALHLIGDAFAPKHLRHAMVDGARTGRAI